MYHSCVSQLCATAVCVAGRLSERCVPMHGPRRPSLFVPTLMHPGPPASNVARYQASALSGAARARSGARSELAQLRWFDRGL